MQRRTFSLALLLVSVALGTQAQNTSPYWSLAGNSNASTSSKLGTTNLIPLHLVTNNLTRVKLFENGRVGVGGRITSANATRVLNPADDNAVMRILRTHSSFAPAVELISRTSPDGANVAYWDFYAEPSDKSFRIRDRVTGANLDRVTITNPDGNVGIGTTTPSQKLHVEGTIYGASSSGSGIYGYSSNTYGYGVLGQSSYIGVYGTSGTYGVFGTATQIGVHGQGGTYGLSGTSTTSTGTGILAQGGTIGVNGSGSTYGLYGYSSLNYGVYGYTGGGGPNSNPFYSSGVYGYNASYGYGVGGYGYYGPGVMGYTVYGWAGYFQGNVYATGTYQGSDRKLKQNITELSSALAIVNKLEPKEYEYKQEGNFKLMNLPKGKRYGLIAQDVERVLPGIVKEAQFDTRMAQQPAKPKKTGEPEVATMQASETIDFKAVNYTELIPILVKALQELNKKTDGITELKARIEKLEALLKTSIHSSSTNISAGYLEQNIPNPARGTTTIWYRVPEGAASVRLSLTNAKGQIMKAIHITGRGTGQVNLDIASLSAGIYNYTLWADGREVDTKQLVITR